MDKYKRQKMIKGWDQSVLAEANVLIIGAGTTGNEVIKNLVLLGVGSLVIVDSDIVEAVNLNRSVLFRESDIGEPKATVAATRARDLNPSIRTVGWNCDIIYSIGNFQYKDFDCVILTVDNLEARMWVNRYCCFNDIPLIDTGVDGLIGNVFVTIPSLESCIECGWGKREYQRLADKYSCLKRGLDQDEPKIPMVITTAAFVGGIAAQECVAILHNKQHLNNYLAAGRFFQYDAETHAWLSWRVPRRDDCTAHAHSIDKSQILLEGSLDQDIGSLKKELASRQSASSVEIWNDKEIVYSVVCNDNCGYAETVPPILLGKFKRAVCPHCNKLSLVPQDVTEELRDGWTMRDLGVPSSHLLRFILAQGDELSEGWLLSR